MQAKAFSWSRKAGGLAEVEVMPGLISRPPDRQDMLGIVGFFDSLHQRQRQLGLGGRVPAAIIDNSVARSGDELSCTQALEGVGEARRQSGQAANRARLRSIPEALFVSEGGFRVQPEFDRLVQL